ncbi:MAG: hypothetical protein CME64_01040 [Halobacteriovoraceae bacterium]|nr:hypothetical protein [Halobacteriovoraceae bacterium]|tara:strand:- start:227049 stop:227423 length:375 start_codon:yes stop_codon:yes gene_type:complete
MNFNRYIKLLLFSFILIGSTLSFSKVKIQGQMFEGKVLKVKKVQFKDSDQENIVVLIKTPRGHKKMVVDLGDSERIQKRARMGTRLKVEGFLVRIEDKEFLMAKRVKVGNRIIKVNKNRKLRAY